MGALAFSGLTTPRNSQVHPCASCVVVAGHQVQVGGPLLHFTLAQLQQNYIVGNTHFIRHSDILGESESEIQTCWFYLLITFLPRGMCWEGLLFWTISITIFDAAALPASFSSSY